MVSWALLHKTTGLVTRTLGGRMQGGSGKRTLHVGVGTDQGSKEFLFHFLEHCKIESFQRFHHFLREHHMDHKGPMMSVWNCCSLRNFKAISHFSGGEKWEMLCRVLYELRVNGTLTLNCELSIRPRKGKIIFLSNLLRFSIFYSKTDWLLKKNKKWLSSEWGKRVRLKQSSVVRQA